MQMGVEYSGGRFRLGGNYPDSHIFVYELEKFCIRSFEAITKTFKFFRKLKKNKIEKLLFLHNRKDRKLNIENQTLYVRLF